MRFHYGLLKNHRLKL